jgi:diguanylate cyclase (GGDEF)-like protein
MELRHGAIADQHTWIGAVCAALNSQADGLPCEDRHRLAVHPSLDGMMVLSVTGEILALNDVACLLIGTGQEAVGCNIASIIPKILDGETTAPGAGASPTVTLIAAGKPILGRSSGLVLADGEVRWVTFSAVPMGLPSRENQPSVLVLIGQTAPSVAARQQARYQRNHDALTGLCNRALLMQYLQQCIAEGCRPAALFIDLDGFKSVNDASSREAGDAVLRLVADRLLSLAAAYGMLARAGADEFVLAVRHCGQNLDLAGLASDIVHTLATPFNVGGREYYLGASIGISAWRDEGDDAATLIHNADTAMYESKKAGRNGFRFFTAALRQSLQRRLVIERALRRALNAGELSIAWQPIVHGQSERVIGAEALLRWHSAELGEVPPDEFIPIAEDFGLIIPIGDWVLRQACHQIAQWRRTLEPELFVSVNLSAWQIRHDLVGTVTECLLRENLDAGALELEITERVLLANNCVVLGTLHEIANRGITISVDDFGIGYSSLSYLLRFPLHNLKVDRSFVSALPGCGDSSVIVRALVSMAHALGMTATVEGVETLEQSALLRSFGCDRQQGYLFSPPVNSGTFAALVSRQRAAQALAS